MLFSARYLDTTGTSRNEVFDASDVKSAQAALRTKAQVILKLRPAGFADRAQLWLNRRFGAGSVGNSELQGFAHVLGNYLKAGISIQEALRLTAIANPKTAKIVAPVRERLAAGVSIDEAIRTSGLAIPANFIALVRAGAESGTLQDVLSSEAKHILSYQEIRRDLMTSLIYPAALTVMCALVVCFMLIAIVPQIRSSISEEALARTSAIPHAIFSASDWLNTLTLMQSLAFMLIFAIAGLLVSSWTRAWRQRALVGAPVIGPILRSLNAASFCQALGTMLGASVRTEIAWRLASEAISQPYMRSQIRIAGQEIVQGAPLSNAVAKAGVFPEDVVAVFALGERTGTLPGLLREVADFHAGEALSKLRKLSGIAAPIVILIAGLLVGIFAVAMMSTILSVNQIYAG